MCILKDEDSDRLLAYGYTNNMVPVAQGVLPVATSLYGSLSQPVCRNLSQIYAVDRLFQVWECRNHHIRKSVLSQLPYME